MRPLSDKKDLAEQDYLKQRTKDVAARWRAGKKLMDEKAWKQYQYKAQMKYREKMKREDPERYKWFVKKNHTRAQERRKGTKLDSTSHTQKRKPRSSFYKDASTKIVLIGSKSSRLNLPYREHKNIVDLTSDSTDVSKTKEKTLSENSDSYSSSMRSFKSIPHTRHGSRNGSPSNIRSPSSDSKEPSPKEINTSWDKKVGDHHTPSASAERSQSQDSNADELRQLIQAWHGHQEVTETSYVGVSRVDKMIEGQRVMKIKEAAHFEPRAKSSKHDLKYPPRAKRPQAKIAETYGKSYPSPDKSQLKTVKTSSGNLLSTERSESTDSNLGFWQGVVGTQHQR